MNIIKTNVLHKSAISNIITIRNIVKSYNLIFRFDRHVGRAARLGVLFTFGGVYKLPRGMTVNHMNKIENFF